MADNKTVIEVEVKGTDAATNSLKNLKKELKEAQAAALNGDGNAAKRVAELKDKLDDLNDATKTLKGSGVERVGSSFGLLGDGLKNLDLDAVKTGFKGLGSAMNAIPLMLIVSGVMMLMEKFDIMGKVVEFITDLFYAFTDAIGITNKADEKFAKEAVANAQNVQKAKEAQYDAEIKMAQAAGQDVKELELEKLKSIEDSIQSQLTALENLKIKKKKLNDEEQKQYDELQLNLMKSSADRMAKELANAKEQQQLLMNLSNLEDKLRVAGLSAREKEIDAVKKQEKQLRDELEKNHKVRLGNEMNDTIRYNEDIKKIQELTQREINQINNKYYQEAKAKKEAEKEKAKVDAEKAKIDAEKAKADAEKAEKDEANRLEKIRIDNENRIKKQHKQENDDLKAQAELNLITFQENADMLLLAKQNKLEIEKNIALENTELTESQKALIIAKYEQDVTKLKEDEAKKQKELKKKTEEQNFKITEQGLKSVQNLSDIVFLAQSSKAKKGSAEAEKLAKKQFQVNKALQLSMAVMDGYKAITASLAQAPVAIGAIPNPAGIASLAFAATTSALNVAKILATQYESTSSGGGGEAPSPSIGSTGETPTITQPMSQQPTTPGTNFDAQGNVIGGGPMKAYVVETEITNKQTTVNRLQSQAEFG